MDAGLEAPPTFRLGQADKEGNDCQDLTLKISIARD